VSALALRAGASKKKITPPGSVGPVYRAGYKVGAAEELKRVVDDLFVRCVTVEGAGARVLLLSFDLIGLLRDFTEALASRLAGDGIAAEGLLVATTHTHAGPDTMGVWGPALGQTGYNERYAGFLLDRAVEAVREALDSSRSARPFLAFAERDLGVSNFRAPDERSLDLWCLSFRADGETVASLISYPAQPELSPRDDDGISADYPGEACRVFEAEVGGTSLFLLGACGGMEPEGCEAGYEAAHRYGRRVAEELVRIVPDARPVSGDGLRVTAREVEIPVENPGFRVAMERGFLRTSRRPPTVPTTLSRVEIGDVELLTLPGESFPGFVRGVGRPQTTLFVNQVNDALGYFLPPGQFRSQPVEWVEGHHFTGHELESLGRGAGEILRRALVRLASG
jgi:hypothetical protein